MGEAGKAGEAGEEREEVGVVAAPKRRVATPCLRMVILGVLGGWAAVAGAEESGPPLTDQLCEQLVQGTLNVLHKTMYQNTHLLVTQPYFNEQAFVNYMLLTDEMKLLHLDSDVSALAQVRTHNIDQLVERGRPHLRRRVAGAPPNLAANSAADVFMAMQPAGQPHCEFVTASYAILQSRLEMVQQMVFELIDATMDLAVQDSIDLLPYSTYAEDEQELRRRWAKQIKFDKLVAALYFEDHSYHVTPVVSLPVREFLKEQYGHFFAVMAHRHEAYLRWLKSFHYLIDKDVKMLSSSALSQRQVVPNAIWPQIKKERLKALPMISLQKLIGRWFPRLDHGVKYSIQSMNHTYPARFNLPLIASDSYILMAYNKLRDIGGERKYWRNFLVLEPHDTHYQWALKSVDLQTSRVQREVNYNFTVQVGDKEVVPAPLDILYLKMSRPHFKFTFPEADYVESDWALYERGLRHEMESWQRKPEAIILDFRGSRFVGTRGLQFLNALSQVFLPEAVLFQRIIKPLNMTEQLYKKRVFRYVNDDESMLMAKQFPMQTPLVILLDDDSLGFVQSFAHSYRLMKRALIVGTGYQAQTSGAGLQMYYLDPSPFADTVHAINKKSLIYNIDGSLLTDRGVNYDIFLPSRLTPLQYQLKIKQLQELPWHQLNAEVLASIGFLAQIAPLSYPDYGMMSAEIIHKLQLRYDHQEALMNHDELAKFTDAINKNDMFKLTLQGSSVLQQVRHSGRASEDQLEHLKKFQHDYVRHAVENSPMDYHVLRFIHQDQALKATLQITADYYHLLKRGSTLSERPLQIIGMK